MRTPCQSDPERWVGDSADEREEAAHPCRTQCNLIDQCRQLATSEEWGVWAGTDLHPGSQRTPRLPCPVCGALMPRTKGRQRRTCIGCVESKTCTQCGGQFPRTYHSQKQWDTRQVCGPKCAAKMRTAA